MGEVIRKDARAADILDDVRTSYIKAIAKQGKWQELADTQLAPTLKVADDVAKQLADARSVASPIFAALGVAHESANKLVGKTYDDVWNVVGRPKYDPALDILFPGGMSFYTESDAVEQGDRLELLVERLKAGVHPKLPSTIAQALAAGVQAEADALRLTSKDALAYRTKVTLLERIGLSVARSAALQLSAFKRVLKAAGFSEAEIHTVIPDRPTRTNGKKAATAPPAPQPGAPAQLPAGQQQPGQPQPPPNG